MFKILGSDGKEYGPVAADTLRRWVRQGRANAQTPVQAEGDAGWTALGQLADFVAEFNAPPPLATPPVAVMDDSALSKVIPYRNGMALAAYYCGIFALIPLLGLVLGWVALGLGVTGLRAARRNPAIGGKVHAWVGIVLGGLCGLGNLLLIVIPLVMAVRSR